MTEGSKRRWWQFRISTILLLMVIAGMSVSRRADRRRHAEEMREMVPEVHGYQSRITFLERERVKLGWGLRDLARQLEPLKVENERESPRRFPQEKPQDGDKPI